MIKLSTAPEAIILLAAEESGCKFGHYWRESQPQNLQKIDSLGVEFVEHLIPLFDHS